MRKCTLNKLTSCPRAGHPIEQVEKVNEYCAEPATIALSLPPPNHNKAAHLKCNGSDNNVSMKKALPAFVPVKWRFIVRFTARFAIENPRSIT